MIFIYVLDSKVEVLKKEEMKMNKSIIAVLALSCGGVAGFLIGKKLSEQHYNQVIQMEIDSVKQAFRRQRKSSKPAEIDVGEKEATQPIEQSSDKRTSKKRDYRRYYPENKAVATQEVVKEDNAVKPYVITPEDFDTIPGYETISLTLYADGVVADDDDNAMSEEDIEETITRDSLSHFGEYEQDSVFVRNDDMRTDYEILLDERRYEDVLKSKPYLKPNN